MNNCLLETHPEYGGCCCKCKFRLRAFAHSTHSVSECIPGHWICIAFAFYEGEDIGYVGDFEHGMCELFMSLPWSLDEQGHIILI